MGRREKGTLNPAQREHQQERQREKKRNKKQKIQVRQAVVKTRNPAVILETLRSLDDQDFSIDAPLSKTVIAERRDKMLRRFYEVITMHRTEKNEREAKRLESMLRMYNEERAERTDHYRAEMFARMENPNVIPLPTGAGFMEPGVAMTPQGTPVVPRRNYAKNSVVHSTLPGPPCYPAPPLSDSEDEDHHDESPREAAAVFQEAVKEDDLEPVEIPADIFLGQRAMGVPLPPKFAPPSRPIFRGASIQADPEVQARATISAGPQMRDMRGEATRFVPTTLRVNRPKPVSRRPVTPKQPLKKSADETYVEFMREMEGLM